MWARTQKPSWKESVLGKNDFPVQETCWCPGLLVIKQGYKVWRCICTLQALERLVGFQHFMDGRSWELFMRGEKTYHESSTWRLAVPARKYILLVSNSSKHDPVSLNMTWKNKTLWFETSIAKCKIQQSFWPLDGCQAPSSWNRIIIIK